MLSAAREVAWTVPLTSRDGHQREGEQHKEVPFGGRARHHYAGAAASSKLSQLGAHMTERDIERKLKAWAKMKYIEDQKNYHCMYSKSTRYEPKKEGIYTECGCAHGDVADRGGGAREPRRPLASRRLHLLLPLTALLYGLLAFTAGDRGQTARGPCETGRAAGYRHT